MQYVRLVSSLISPCVMYVVCDIMGRKIWKIMCLWCTITRLLTPIWLLNLLLPWAAQGESQVRPSSFVSTTFFCFGTTHDSASWSWWCYYGRTIWRAHRCFSRLVSWSACCHALCPSPRTHALPSWQPKAVLRWSIYCYTCVVCLKPSIDWYK